MADIIKELFQAQTVKSLLYKGWVYPKFYIDFTYLNNLGLESIFKESVLLLGAVAEEALNPNRNFIKNFSSLFDESLKAAYQKWLLRLTPNFTNTKESDDFSICCFKDINNPSVAKAIINKIDNLLKHPVSIYQVINNYPYDIEVLSFPIDKYTSSDKLDCEDIIIISFDNNCKLKIIKQKDREGTYKIIYFPTEQLKEYYVSLACQNLSILKTKTQLIFGECNSKFSLDSFNIPSLTSLATNKVKSITEYTSSEKLSLLLTGAPGTGKTSWVNAFVKEVISPLGYLTINLDLESLSEFTPPDYINKICLVINDGDNLALARENRSDGFTEKVMSLLDGNQLNCMTPFNNSNLKLIIIITANTTERWDKAALRKGRIDIDYEFTEPAYN